jgi:16S rRNA processing protein RimM
LEVGYVLRAHGVRGELRVVTHDPTSTALEDTDAIYIGGKAYAAELRRIEGAYLVKLEGVTDRDVAERLRGQPVAVPRAAIELDPGEVLLADLIGCRVRDANGTDYGTVMAVDVGPQPRLVVKLGNAETLLPVVEEFLESIDVDAKEIVVSLPEGFPTGLVP